MNNNLPLELETIWMDWGGAGGQWNNGGVQRTVAILKWNKERGNPCAAKSIIDTCGGGFVCGGCGIGMIVGGEENDRKNGTMSPVGHGGCGYQMETSQ